MRNRKGLLTLAASTVILSGSILLGTIATGQGATELARPVIISNTPLPVNINNAPIPITNDGTNSLLVKAASTPVHFSCDATFAAGGSRTSNLACYTVPVGMRLVIEEASADYSDLTTTAHPITEAVFQSTTGGATVAFEILVSDRGTIGSNHLYAGSGPTRSYGDAGTVVQVAAARASTGDGTGISFHFAGYLVVVP